MKWPSGAVLTWGMAIVGRLRACMSVTAWEKSFAAA